MVAACAGIFVGSICAFFAVRILKSQLYGVALYDPTTLLAVPLLLGIVAGVASGIPTLRVTKIDPAETLRAE